VSSRGQRVRVGAFTIGLLALVAVVLIVFGGFHLWERHARYRIVFATSVFGLENGSLVYLDGVQVGQVVGLALLRDEPGKVAVTIEVARGVPIRTDTAAMLQLAGLTGLRVIELEGGTTTAGLLPEGGTIAAGESALDRLQRNAEHLVAQSDQLVEKANHVLDNVTEITDPRKWDGIEDMIAKVRVAADDVAAVSVSARAMVEEDRPVVHETLVTTREAAQRARAIVEGPFTQVSADAGEIVAEVRSVVQANAGPLQAAVVDLRRASKSIAELARELRERPSRLLFSRAPPARAPP
jgi:phospholipid/cholesterol/gamma-HCH transport system substrate-binding protein